MEVDKGHGHGLLTIIWKNCMETWLDVAYFDVGRWPIGKNHFPEQFYLIQGDFSTDKLTLTFCGRRAREVVDRPAPAINRYLFNNRCNAAPNHRP